MNHPDPSQPDPNDSAPDSPRADRGEQQGPTTHFGQIISNVEGQLEQLHRVESEMDEQASALDAQARELAAREGEAAPVNGSGPAGDDLERRARAVSTIEAGLAEKIRAAEARFANLAGEQETFVRDREQWVAQRREAETNLQEREAELAQHERDFAVERDQLAAIAARVAEERARQLEQPGAGADAAGELAAATERCAALEAQLAGERERAERAEAAGIELAQDVEAERDAARAELETVKAQLAALEEDRANAPARSADDGKVDEAKVGSDLRMRAMQQKITKLEALLAAKHPQLAAQTESATQQEQIDDMREKAQRLSLVAEHLRRRHYRLRQVRHLLKKKGTRRVRPAPTGPDPRRAAAAAEQHAEQVRLLEGRRHELGEKAATLAESERRMIRRWARARAVVLVGWIFTVGVVAAGIAWLTACQIVPPVRSASVIIDARARDRASLTEEQAAAWRAWHTQIVAEDTFLGALSLRLDERQIETFPDTAAIDARLSRDLSFAAIDGDSLMLTLSGRNPDEITTLLDLIASTIVVESGRLLRKRTAEPWATLGGVSAVLNPTPLEDHRLPWAGGLFAALYLVLIGLGLVIYKRLARVKHEFDADGMLFRELKPTSDGAVQAVAVIGD